MIQDLAPQDLKCGCSLKVAACAPLLFATSEAMRRLMGHIIWDKPLQPMESSSPNGTIRIAKLGQHQSSKTYGDLFTCACLSWPQSGGPLGRKPKFSFLPRDRGAVNIKIKRFYGSQHVLPAEPFFHWPKTMNRSELRFFLSCIDFSAKYFSA